MPFHEDGWKFVKVEELLRILSTLPSEYMLRSNQVGNLSILDDLENDPIGFIDFADCSAELFNEDL
jgi:aminoglycoside/choline kinase family phosphotransferase